MVSPTMNSGSLPLAWQLLVVLLALVPTGWAAVANCTSGWDWVSFAFLDWFSFASPPVGLANSSFAVLRVATVIQLEASEPM